MFFYFTEYGISFTTLKKEIFHIGRVTTLTKLQRQRRIISSIHKLNKNPITNINMNTAIFNPVHTSLLGNLETIPEFVKLAFHSCSSTYHGRQTYLKNRTDENMLMSKNNISFIPNYIEELTKWFVKEQTVKMAFLKLLQYWRYSKYKNRMLNVEDPVTMMVPIKPIYIFDMHCGGVYVFEASSLKKRIECELTYAQWLFPCSTHPKNPLTNIEFTECQRIAILKHLRKENQSSWLFEAYRSCNWNLNIFKLYYKIPLKIAALKEIVRNPSSEEAIEYMQEFIDYHLSYHKSSSDARSYRKILNWAVEYEYNTLYMRKWLKLFEENYTYIILHTIEDVDYNDTIEYYDHKQNLYRKTLALLNDHDEYKSLKLKYLKTREIKISFHVSDANEPAVSEEIFPGIPIHQIPLDIETLEYIPLQVNIQLQEEQKEEEENDEDYTEQYIAQEPDDEEMKEELEECINTSDVQVNSSCTSMNETNEMNETNQIIQSESAKIIQRFYRKYISCESLHKKQRTNRIVIKLPNGSIRIMCNLSTEINDDANVEQYLQQHMEELTEQPLEELHPSEQPTQQPTEQPMEETLESQF